VKSNLTIQRLDSILKDMSTPSNYYTYPSTGPWQMVQTDKWNEWQSRLLMIRNNLEYELEQPES